MRLTLQQAVDLALAPDGNTRVQIARNLRDQSRARAAQARSALLPDVRGGVSWQNQTRNLAAFGIRFQAPIPGFQFPELVGPFSVLDVRGQATQSVFDLSSILRYRAAGASARASSSEETVVRNDVAAQVARAYLAALRREASVEAAQASVELGQRLLELAESQKRAGTATGLEITRAQVQLADARQRLVMAEHGRSRARLELLRAIGLDLDTMLELATRMDYVAPDPLEVSKALEIARSQRPELRAQSEREHSASLNYAAARAERLPSLAAFGDYGTIGSGSRLLPTRTYGVTLSVPVFDGGRRGARRAEAAAGMRMEALRSKDVREQVELEVRLALDLLQSADAQVAAAEEGLKLAEDELAHAERRYRAGVGASIEVTDAQTRLERARDNRIAALFAHNSARIDLSAALGRQVP
jgi:outer membrane protein TolC